VASQITAPGGAGTSAIRSQSESIAGSIPDYSEVPEKRAGF